MINQPSKQSDSNEYIPSSAPFRSKRKPYRGHLLDQGAKQAFGDFGKYSVQEKSKFTNSTTPTNAVTPILSPLGSGQITPAQIQHLRQKNGSKTRKQTPNRPSILVHDSYMQGSVFSNDQNNSRNLTPKDVFRDKMNKTENSFWSNSQVDESNTIIKTGQRELLVIEDLQERLAHNKLLLQKKNLVFDAVQKNLCILKNKTDH